MARALEDETAVPRDHRVVTEQVPGGDWRIDPDSSAVNIKARTGFGLLPVNGYFNAFAGELHVAAGGAATGELRVATASVKTGIDRRDDSLRAPEFLDAEAYPWITFALGGLAPRAPEERIVDEPRMTANGVLHLQRYKLPLTFPVTVIEHADHLHIEARARVDYHAAGVPLARPGLIGKHAWVGVALTLRRF
jgi:polyisoprenoid-binding protein YceI